MEICNECKKKRLILFDCRCGKKFCIKHKDDFKHSCSFDYHQKEKEKLNKQKVKFNKINLI